MPHNILDKRVVIGIILIKCENHTLLSLFMAFSKLNQIMKDTIKKLQGISLYKNFCMWFVFLFVNHSWLY